MFLTACTFVLNSGCYVFNFIYSVFVFLHAVLPYGLDVGILGLSAYYLTRLKKPDPCSVMSVFGPVAGSRESMLHPEKMVSCIAHRGAGLDAPENTLEAFRYVSATFFDILYLASN